MRARWIRLITSMLSPPNSKKPRSAGTSGRPSSSANSAQTVRSVAVRGARPSTGRACGPGTGSALRSTFPAGRQRQLGQRHVGGGHHVRGQEAARALAQHGRRGQRATGRRHQVGHQLRPLLPVRAHHGHRLPDIRVRGQHRLHLARLDPEAPQFHHCSRRPARPRPGTPHAPLQQRGEPHGGRAKRRPPTPSSCRRPARDARGPAREASPGPPCPGRGTAAPHAPRPAPARGWGSAAPAPAPAAPRRVPPRRPRRGTTAAQIRSSRSRSSTPNTAACATPGCSSSARSTDSG